MKRILLFITTITITSVCHAQFLNILNLRYGAELGMGITTLNQVKTQTATSQNSQAVAGKTSISLGLVAEKGFSDHFGLHTGLLYAQKGSKANTINYLEIPVNIVYFRGEGHGLFMNLGPYIGYAIGGSGVNIGKATDTSSLTSNWGIKSIDYGVQFGLGIATRSGWYFKGSFELGIPDLNYKETSVKINNGAIMFTIGWLFGGESMYEM